MYHIQVALLKKNTSVISSERDESMEEITQL